MAVVAYINGKGGVGKSTKALNTTDHFAQKGAKVLLIDADRQQSIGRALEKRKDAETKFTFIPLVNETVHKQVTRMQDDYDLIVIDTPGSMENLSITRSIMAVSDLVVVPVGPSMVELEASLEVLDLKEEIDTIRPHDPVKVAFSLGRTRRDTQLYRAIRQSLLNLPEGYPLIDADIRHIEIFAKAFSLGYSIYEMTPKMDGFDASQKGKAVNDMNAFCGELSKVLGNYDNVVKENLKRLAQLAELRAQGIHPLASHRLSA